MENNKHTKRQESFRAFQSSTAGQNALLAGKKMSLDTCHFFREPYSVGQPLVSKDFHLKQTFMHGNFDQA